MNAIARFFRTDPGRRVSCAAPGAALALAASIGAVAAGIAVREEPALRLEVTPLMIEGGATRSAEPGTVEATRDEAGVLETALAWSPLAPPWTLTLEVEVMESAGEDGHTLRLSATVRVPGASPVRSSRELTLSEGGTGLFDVVEQDGRRVVLSIRAERVVRPVVAGRRRVGAPVLFQLGVERRDGERSVPLETNRLTTFLREGVEYAFSRGGGAGRESLRLVLTPLRLEGDVAEVEVDVSGSLPGASGPLLLSRKERILTSRRATSSFDVIVGDPPVGYRFRITPDF